jgi:hypothetical protein
VLQDGKLMVLPDIIVGGAGYGSHNNHMLSISRHTREEAIDVACELTIFCAPPISIHELPVDVRPARPTGGVSIEVFWKPF